MKIFKSTSALTGQEPPSLREMLQLPSPGSHPVLIARKLLVLGSLLQGALSAASDDMRDHLSALISRVVDTATRLVTKDDDLTASVEGIECIMLEAIMQNYAGSLHRAWLTVRRAAAVAQMLGLHRGAAKLSSLKILDPETRSRLDPDQLCFRIVEMDSYLSITLGLPKSSLETVAMKPHALANCHPLDRMARLQCIIAGLIITQSTDKEPRDTHEMDQLLQTSAAEMPPQWWLVPRFEHNDDDDDITRSTYQFSHYHLVIRLHLPHMLRVRTDDNKYHHSMFSAVHASREILARYITFRTCRPSQFYCRGIDYLAFIALAVLCLAHIATRSTAKNSLSALAYSYPSDRGMMERSVEMLNSTQDDAIALRLSRIMQCLVDADAAAAAGACFATETCVGETVEGTCGGWCVDGGEKTWLRVFIPYFGTVNLLRKTFDNPEFSSGDALLVGRSMLTWDNNQGAQQLDGEMDVYGSELDDWTLQSINEGLFGTLFDFGGGSG
jgi:hypothetical protein